MEQATLSPFNNRWSCVHDFTPSNDVDAKHFTLKNKNPRDEESWTIFEESLFAPLKSRFPVIGQAISCDPEKSVVPLTMFENPQQKRCRPETGCLILLFQQPGRTIFQRNGDILSLLHHLRQKDCDLVSSSESKMNEIHAERMTNGKNFNKNLIFGSVVGLQLLGPDCSIVCRNLLETLKNEIGPFFVTDEKNYYEKFKLYSGFVNALNNV
uniref:Uncharacterized protein n=1 Tax=Romanomermis culicivorax TaxID=13658 RepID=A0A915JZ70_ROMCU